MSPGGSVGNRLEAPPTPGVAMDPGPCTNLDRSKPLVSPLKLLPIDPMIYKFVCQIPELQRVL